MTEKEQDDEKNVIVNIVVDLSLTLTENVIRLRDLIEYNTTRMAFKASTPLHQYCSSFCTGLVEPYICNIRQQQQQQQQEQDEQEEQEEQEDYDDDEVFEESGGGSNCEDMIDGERRRDSPINEQYINCNRRRLVRGKGEEDIL